MPRTALLLGAFSLACCAAPPDDLRASTVTAYWSNGPVAPPDQRSRRVELRPGGELVVSERLGGVELPERRLRLDAGRYEALIAELEAAGANRPWPSDPRAPVLVGAGTQALTVSGVAGARTQSAGGLTPEGSRRMSVAIQALVAVAAPPG